MMTTKNAGAMAMTIAQGALLAMLGAGCATASTPPVQSATMVSGTTPTAAPATQEKIRLYTLDCGRFVMPDMGFFTESGKPNGVAKTLADPCFVIKHPKGVLLWDTGLEESISQKKDGLTTPLGKEFVDVPLSAQLKTLELKPSDITFVGFSHLHGDHAGNANAFTASTWLLNRAELEDGLKKPPPVGVEQAPFSEYKNAKIKLLEADEDVFGDGRVVILQTPGHTAGHQSLMVQLAGAGTVILSGDLAHTLDNWKNHIVPGFNKDREKTLVSMKRIEGLIAEKHARFVVQHSEEDFHAMPKFPAYLE